MLYFAKNVVSVWIGTTDKDIAAFNNYTAGMDDPQVDCPARKEIGMIDIDLFVAYGTQENEVIPVACLLKEADTYSEQTDCEIVKKAAELGIITGNSLYTCRNTVFIEEIPGRLYNDLRFIGTFADPPKKK